MAKIKNTSTQNFIRINKVLDDVVIFSDGNACLVIELTATNFSLLSAQEQDAKIYAYAALLNSLSFPTQIVIRSKRLDISSYLKLLDEEAAKTPNQKLSEQIKLYRGFVGELVKVNTILDKKFYIVIPYSHLEKIKAGDNFEQTAKAALHSKASSLNSQLARLNLRSKILDGEGLVRLFYEIYNEERNGVVTV